MRLTPKNTSANDVDLSGRFLSHQTVTFNHDFYIYELKEDNFTSTRIKN